MYSVGHFTNREPNFFAYRDLNNGHTVRCARGRGASDTFVHSHAKLLIGSDLRFAYRCANLWLLQKRPNKDTGKRDSETLSFCITNCTLILSCSLQVVAFVLGGGCQITTRFKDIRQLALRTFEASSNMVVSRI